MYRGHLAGVVFILAPRQENVLVTVASAQDLKEHTKTGDLAQKAKVLRCRHRHALPLGAGTSVELGVALSVGEFDFGPDLVDGAGTGVASPKVLSLMKHHLL